MSIPIPHRARNAVPRFNLSPPPPPDEYQLMAAAQMHSEGRLIQPPTGEVNDKIASIPEAATAPIRT